MNLVKWSCAQNYPLEERRVKVGDGCCWVWKKLTDYRCLPEFTFKVRWPKTLTLVRKDA